MIKFDTLSARIAIAMLSLITVIVITLSIVFYFTYDHMEHKLLEMLDGFASQSLNQIDPDLHIVDVDFALSNKQNFFIFTENNDTPKVFRELKSGFHHYINYNESIYHVAIKDIGESKKYLVFNITDVETEEHILSKIVILAPVSVLVLSLWIIYWLSRKVIKPVREFADEVGTLDPNVRNFRIAEKYDNVEISLIASSFDRYMERLDEFVEREQSFTSTVSHELRTPLSVISTSAELLENNKEFPNSCKIYIEQIKKNATDMTNLISALLFLAREDVPNNYNPPEQTDVTLLTQSIVDTYRYAVNNKDINFIISKCMPIQVDAPKSHVQMIISNLLNNAIRYTQNGEITIKLDKDKIEIRDTGKGIDMHTLDQVFERGFKSKDSTGHGFGLYICKRICERYGWAISIFPNQDIGVTASVKF